ncbi:MAG: teichoic acid transporter, partial [Blastocatellia bacterium]
MTIHEMRSQLTRFLHRNDATDVERGHRRLARAGLTGAATLVARGMTMLIGLATLPLTSHYLGKDRFGLWLTLSSFIAWVSIADLGLSNSLINALSMADGDEDKEAAREAVASTFWIASLVAAGVIVAGMIVLPLVSWSRVFNIASAEAASEIAPTLAVILIFSALRLPASIVGCIYHGYQEGYVYQLWNGLSGLLGTIGLIAAIKLKAGLPWLAAAFLGSM